MFFTLVDHNFPTSVSYINGPSVALMGHQLHYCVISFINGPSVALMDHQLHLWIISCINGSSVAFVAVVCVTTIAVPGDILIGASPVGGSSTNNYANTRVLSQCLLLPAHTIRNEN